VSESFDLPELTRLLVGTVGPPGQRVFHLQAHADGAVVTLKLEKGQVAALAEYLGQLLADLQPLGDVAADPVPLQPPVVPAWTVGSMGVSYDEDLDRILVVAEEIEGDVPVEEPGTARFRLTRAQTAQFVADAGEVVAAGRPPCPLCGRPMDPTGHVCVKTNGHSTH
jgi:uncharacterized repeat protein (TIGR03847 family)